MKRLFSSITGRLVSLLLIGASLLLLLAGVLLYEEVHDLVLSSMDRSLHSKLQMVTGLVHLEDGELELELAEIIEGEYALPLSGHYYRVMTDGDLLAVSPSLVEPGFVFTPDSRAVIGGADERMFSSFGPAGEPVRVLTYQYRAYGQTIGVTIAESLVEGLAMADAFKHFLLVFSPTALALLCLFVWWTARSSLRQLTVFSGTIEKITHDNLSDRIDVTAAPQELETLGHSFNDMLARLNAIFEVQKRLVADASHELKTPVSVIRTQCDVALQRPRQADEYVEALHDIHDTSKGMAKLINDLLSLARIDAGLISPTGFENVSVKDCIMDAMRMAGPLADERRVRLSLSVDESLRVMASRTALSEAFLNLIENAVRYNIADGSVSVNATASDGVVVVVISDTGIGIGNQELGRIFERFYRADGVRSMDGSGLGLSIVKSIVEAHGGSIRAESEPGKGSTFTLTLPASDGTNRAGRETRSGVSLPLSFFAVRHTRNL